MPLDTATPRERLHTRTVTCDGFRRDDGLWDIDGHLTDVKSYPFTIPLRGNVQVGEPLHEMWIRLTVDDDMTVRAIQAVTDHSPYPAICPNITDNFQSVVGLTIGPGWTRAIKARLGGVKGCTHLVELLGPLATTAFQTVRSGQQRLAEAIGASRPQDASLIDTCHAYRADGEVVRRLAAENDTGNSGT